MLSHGPVHSNLIGLEALSFIFYVAILLLIASPAIIMYGLWRIFVPPRDRPTANMLGLDPETSDPSRDFCWSGIPLWKVILFAVLALMTLIY